MTESHYVVDVLILLLAAVIAVPLFKRLGLGSVLGYLAAGALVGPFGLGFIGETDQIRTLAEFGVVFLLFSIGIEMKPGRLWSMRRMVFGLGFVQVFCTGWALVGFVVLIGQSPTVAVITGFGLALSSTAFCLQLMVDRGELGTRYGRTAFAVLLLQDLAVVPLLTLVAMLSADTPLFEGIESAMLEGVLVVGGVILIGRYLLGPALGLVASSQMAEVFTAAAILVVLGAGWLLEEAGLSMALGAFLAGISLANSHYRHQVIADIQPFRGMLLGLFFMGVGMTINSRLLWENAWLYALLVPGLLLAKSAILWVLCRLLRVGKSDAVRVSLLLSQSGEFGFVIFGLAAMNGLLSPPLHQFLTLLVALTMLTTPLMPPLANAICRRLDRGSDDSDVSTDHLDTEQRHVIIAGFGRVGRRIATILQAGDVPYLVVESSIDRVTEGRQAGFPVFYGDAGNVDVLKAAGAGQAEILVCTLDAVEPAVRLVHLVQHHHPELAIHARGHDRQHCDRLLQAGATVAVSESLEASLQLAESVLENFGTPEEEAAALVATFRREYYG